MPAPIYSIVVPAYNEAGELPATLAALRRAMRAQRQPGELIVVNNNSTDATALVAKREGADKVVFERINQIARARNAGAAAAAGRYLVFVDADTRISPRLLRDALAALVKGAACGGGARVRFEGETTLVGRFGIRLWEHISRFTRTAAGSFLFCRRDAFDAVGGFDERLYAGEEVRLSRLLKRWGRSRRLDFVIFRDAPVETSARKLQWYSSAEVLGWVALMILLPFAVRSRRLCAFWYKRPQAE